MSELRQMLALWRASKERGEEVCVATVVNVAGSAYRKPGARMLITSGGQRAGTISGGCLESEVGKRAWWLTANGAALERYNSFFDEDTQAMQGLGCGGTVTLLLERKDIAMKALACAVEERTGVAIVHSLEAPYGILHCESAAREVLFSTCTDEGLARSALRSCGSSYGKLGDREVFVEYLAPPPALCIFGAGDDAVPVCAFAHALDWQVTIADGRSHLARAERFPKADRVMTLGSTQDDLPRRVGDAAILMTHSYEQDRRLLPLLLSAGLRYLGVLGPRKRTQQLVREAALKLGWTEEECLARLHSPAGFDLGAQTPSAIALAIVAEIQAVLAGRQREGAPQKTAADTVCA